MMRLFVSACVISAVFTTPIAVFHGFGDACSNAGMKKFTNQLGQALNVYSTCIEIGNGSASSIGMDFKKQAVEACANIQSDVNLKGQTINVVGLSQGALIARYIVEECDFGGQVAKLLSIGGPQMGVSAFPHCKEGVACYPINKITKSMVYTEFIQSHIGPAGYFRDAGNLDKYLSNSHFLPDLNNERDASPARKERVLLKIYFDQIQALSGLMLVKFNSDTMIHPKETAWFQQWNENGDIIVLEDTDFYKNDFVGIRYLKEHGKAKFVEIEGDHLRFQQSDIDNTFIPFLKD